MPELMNLLKLPSHSQSPSRLRLLSLIIGIATLCSSQYSEAADPADPASGVEGITLSDPELQVELLDTHPDEFFLSHDMDLQGRLYLGSREGVFVYERSDDGGFQPRKELYRFPKDTWVYDIEAFGDELLVLTNTALFRLHDALGAEPTLEKILWGNPLGHHHQGLHGIDFAPDGDLLIVMGDPHPGILIDKARPDHLWKWTWYVGPENRPVAYAGVGAVMRLNLDTYDLSVYASGLRNACGFSFDRDWNLFANDNDQEGSTANPGRLVSVPQYSWNSWARGWDTSQNPARLDMIPNVNWELDVPVGQGYYDDTALGEEYRGSLFVANWGNRSVSRHPIESQGAGFRAETLPFLRADGDRRPVSAMPTNEGNLIVSLCYMTGNEGSPYRQTDLVLVSPRKSSENFAYDFSDQSLIELLSESVQIRAKAHREILRQGGTVLEGAAKAFVETEPTSPAFSSLIFLAAAHGDAASIERITSLAQGEGRSAVLAWKSAAAWPEKFPALTEEVIDTVAAKQDEPVLLAGLLEFLHSAKRSIPDSVAGLAAHDDPFVRQSAAILLARQASDDQLAALAEGNADQRLASTLATTFRLWESAETVQELPEGGQLAVEKHMSLLHPEGPIDLRDMGATVGIYRMADWWQDAKVRKANQGEFDRLQTALSDSDESVANQAAIGLFFLNDNRVDAQVTSVLEAGNITLSMVAGTISKEELRKALRALTGAKLSTDTEIPEAFRKINWDSETAPVGNVENGQLLFSQRGCIACHLAPHDGAGGAIGPTLVGVGDRFPPSYLAASLLVPNLTVSPNFHPNTVTMKDGAIHTGFVETGAAPGMLNLRVITGQIVELDKNEIAKQDASEQSMMPAGLVTTPAEMADLIAYMREKPKKATSKNPARKKATRKKAAPTTASPAPAQSVAHLKALSDWDTTGNWKVDDEGAFVLTPRPGEVNWKRYGDYLWTKQPYRDFAISFEYKHEAGGNSGLYFNVTDPQNAVGSVIEVQIRDSYEEKELNAHDTSGGILPGVIPKANTAKPAGEWNQMRVRSLNGLVTVMLNGEPVNSVQLTQARLKDKPKQGYIGFQDHGLPFWLRNITIRDLSSPKTDPEDPASLTVQQTINPLRPNSILFPSTQAKFVRVDILESSQGQPCIDEVEIYSTESTNNLALHSTGAKASASSLIAGHPEKHQIEHLNDGQYGLRHSWIPAAATGWAQIELPEVTAIDSVILSCDRDGKLDRRIPIAFDILVSVDGEEWNAVKKVRAPKAGEVGRVARAAKRADVPASTEPKVAHPLPTFDDTGFTPIFDGKSLDQWDHIEGAWEVADGSISCTGKEKERNWIIWRGGTPSDFILRLEFKYTAGNSGVQVRSDDLGNHQVFGYQVEIAPQNKMGLWHHSLLEKEDSIHGARFFMATAGQEVTITADGEKSFEQVADAEEVKAHSNEEGWNSLEIIVEGNTLTQKINGVVFSKVTDNDTRMSRKEGVIALQDHGKGCLADFRNIRIKELAVEGE